MDNMLMKMEKYTSNLEMLQRLTMLMRRRRRRRRRKEKKKKNKNKNKKGVDGRRRSKKKNEEVGSQEKR